MSQKMQRVMSPRSMILGIAALMMLALPHVAFAECPKGKVGITIVTPSGKEKQLCVPEQAVSGIENAAENSGTVIVPASCPCWTAAEVELVISRNPDYQCANEPISLCVDGVYAPSISCATKLDGRLFSVGKICIEGAPLACENRFSLDPILEHNLTEDEYDACLATMKGVK